MTSILAYHQLDHRPGLGISCVSPVAFEHQLGYLLEYGFRAVPLADVHKGRSTDDRFAITFDDGLALQLERALPILQRLGVSAHAFVVTDFVGRTASWDYGGRSRHHADWDLLRRWVDAGMTVGSHGRSHRDLRCLSEQELEAELRESRATLAERLHCDIDTISYPFGRCNARVVAQAAESGYRLGVTVRPGLSQQDPLRMPRAVVSRFDTKLSLEHRLRPTLWGSLERGKQRIISAWAGGTIWYQALRDMAA